MEFDQNKEPKNRLGNCEVCSVKEAKYTCPRCEVKTCCFMCQSIHKKELNCDGTRDRTKFIPLHKFTDMDLASDYRLLEEVGRAVEQHKKESRTCRKFLPVYLQKLKQHAAQRKTDLRILPIVFQKRKKNTTTFDNESQTLFWHVDWVFPLAENLVLPDDKINENEKISSSSTKFFVKQEDKVLQDKLQFYQSTGQSNVIYLLKAERKGNNKFYELDPDQTLRQCLKNKVIIEYPEIYIVMNHHKDCFEILSENEEEDVKPTLTNNTLVDRLIKNEEKESSLKNLLFTNEFTDSSDDENDTKVRKPKVFKKNL